MELTFQHRSQAKSFLILQFLISLLSLIKRRILLSLNDTAILIQGFEINLAAIIHRLHDDGIYYRRERRRSLAFHHSHHLSLQHLRNTLVVHQVHILLGKLPIKTLGVLTLHSILPDAHLLKSITKTIIAESLQLSNILISKVKLLVKLPRVLESGILAHHTR